jgi:hypothetical protein
MRAGGPKILINIAHSSQMYLREEALARSLATRSIDATAMLPCSCDIVVSKRRVYLCREPNIGLGVRIIIDA